MEFYANDFVTALAAPVGLADTTIAVLTSANSPAAQFRIVIAAEYMMVTAKAGNTYEVTRGIEGSIAAAHLANAEVAHVLTVAGLKALILQNAAYAHIQASPLAIWTIPHNLGRYPSIVITDNLNNVLACDIFYVDENIAQVIHSMALIGNAYCS